LGSTYGGAVAGLALDTGLAAADDDVGLEGLAVTVRCVRLGAGLVARVVFGDAGLRTGDGRRGQSEADDALHGVLC